jgi:radical SAM protein with 4Fe4S-binding SPASM domain
MNLGFHNADDLKSLIDELADRFTKKKGFRAYVHELFEDQGFTPLIHSEAEKNELSKIKNSLNAYIREKGCRNAEDSQKLPALKTFYCMADTPTSLLINPLGQLGKCEHALYTDMVGDVENGYDFNSPTAKHWLNPKYVEECEMCELYPYCGQIEACETRSVCFSDIIREGNIDSVRIRMRKAFEGGKTDEKTRS